MSEQIEGIRGEFRCLTPKEIGAIVSVSRAIRGIKRAVLASQANVSEKTIERLEKGLEMSEGTYRRIASTLGLKKDAFIQELYVPDPDQIEQVMARSDEERRKHYSSVTVRRVNDVRLVTWLFNTCALLVDDSEVSPNHLERIAVLKDLLKDGDVVSEISECEGHQYARQVLEEVKRIEQLGYEIKAGLADRHKLTNGSSWNMAVYAIFKKREGSLEATPDEVWLPRKMPVC